MNELIHRIVGIIIEAGQSDTKKFRLGETIRYSPSEILEILKQHESEIFGEGSSTQTNAFNTLNALDLISRQAAIDAIEKHIDTFDAIDTNYLDGLRTAMNLLHELPSAQLDTYWKEQCQSYEQTINKLRESLSTQPEIIRCKDCKHRDKYGCCKHWKGLAMGDIQIATDDNDFCSQAERREVTT